MKNTLERILSNGTRLHPNNDYSFLIVVSQNNPLSGPHYMAAIDNNPGGVTPKFNPDAEDELVEHFLKMIFKDSNVNL